MGRRLIKLNVVFAFFFLNGCFDPSFPNTCFLPGTIIGTPEGDTPIEEVQVGQDVYSYDEQTGQIVVGFVEEVIEIEAHGYLDFSLSNGRNLRVTTDHPLALREFDSEKVIRWVNAGDLEPGAKLLTRNEGGTDQDNSPDTKLAVVQVLAIEEVEGLVTVYNLKVRRYRNSFAEGVLTHFYFPSAQQANEPH